MSTLKKTGDAIKKKLLLQDYYAEQHDVISLCQQDGMPSHQQADNTTQQQAVSPVSQHDDLSVHKHTSTVTKKIKVTHYISKEDNDRLTKLYIKRLQEKKKVDKSMLISQAIELLSKQEDVY